MVSGRDLKFYDNYLIFIVYTYKAGRGFFSFFSKFL